MTKRMHPLKVFGLFKMNGVSYKPMDDDQLEELEKQVSESVGEYMLLQNNKDLKLLPRQTVLMLINEVQDLRAYCKHNKNANEKLDQIKKVLNQR